MSFQGTFDVDFTVGHDWAHAGLSRWSIMADNEDDAMLLAAQCVAAVGDHMPTCVTPVL